MLLEIEAMSAARKPEAVLSAETLEAIHHLVMVYCQASNAMTWVVCCLCSCMQNKSTPARVHMNTKRKTSNDYFDCPDVVDRIDGFVYRA